MIITTNHHRREIVDAWEVPANMRERFDYLDWPAIERGEGSASFIQYRGEWYDLNDLEPGPGSKMPDSLKGWHAYVSDSFLSGTLFRWVEDDGEWYVIVGHYYENGE